jgi:hypothetical protein
MDLNTVISYSNCYQDEVFDFISGNILFFSIAFAAVVGKIKESSKQNQFTMWIVYFMGTFFHELAHFLISFVTYGKPYWFSVIPHSEINEETGQKMITLGHVKSLNVKWWNVFFISMAPFLLFPFAYFIYIYFYNYAEMNIWFLMLYIFFIISLLFSAIPSSVDFSNVFNKNFLSNLIIPILLITICCFFKNQLVSFLGGLF